MLHAHTIKLLQDNGTVFQTSLTHVKQHDWREYALKGIATLRKEAVQHDSIARSVNVSLQKLNRSPGGQSSFQPDVAERDVV